MNENVPVASPAAAPVAPPLPREGFIRLSPLNRRRLQNFKANRRGYWSFWIFMVLFVLSLFAELIANDRPILASYRGELLYPAFVDYPEEMFDRVMAVNVKGVWLGMKTVAPLLRARGGGAIVNTASIAGLHGSRVPLVAYTASKHAVIGLTRTGALELARHGIRVNAVCPSPIETAMVRALETGLPAASGRVRLVQEDVPGSREQAGFLVYVPVYGSGEAVAPEHPREHLRGFVYAAFRMGDLVEGLRFPGDLRSCGTCHVAGSFDLPLPDGVLPSLTTPPISAVCTSCHDGTSTAAHAEIMTTMSGAESCETCHGVGAIYDMTQHHRLDP